MPIQLDHNSQIFAVIIGEGVTKGARSPVLWNRAFEGLGIDAKMLPVDVSGSDDLKAILDDFLEDPRFIGGAVAAPLKLSVARYSSGLSPYNRDSISPVNCFYRDHQCGIQVVNTDILAAIESIERVRPIKEFNSTAIIGSGAIAQGLCSEIHSRTKLSVFRRNPAFDRFFQEVGCTLYEISRLSSKISDFDLIVNCTSVGKDGGVDEALLTEQDMQRAARNCLIFDVNYINRPSKMLRLAQEAGLQTLDGLRMNLVQAALAFHLATGRQYEVDRILGYMEGK